MTAVTNAAGFPVLSLITWLPLVGCLVMMMVRGDEETVASNARWTALWTSLLVFILSLVLWVKFDPSDAGFQFNERLAWLPEYKVAYSMGVDGISVLFVLLSTVLGVHSHSGPGIHDEFPDPGNHDGRHVRRDGLRRVLHVL